jgi:DNA-binding transcriptional MerR regulator
LSVNDEELLGIGAFAMLGGLTVEALRHYHEIGLLSPARVEPSTGYRLYRRQQIRDAHVVRALRAVELPLSEIREVLRCDDEARVRACLLAHRERLSSRARLVSGQLAMLEHYIEKGVSVPVPKGNRIVMINIAVDDLERSRRFYEELLDVEFAEERHADGPLHLNATFGEWNTPSWFLLSLWPDSDRAGTIDIGFLVENLDRTYGRALAAGASNVYAPRDVPGMPRTAQIEDPNGNQIGLYQA